MGCSMCKGPLELNEYYGKGTSELYFADRNGELHAGATLKAHDGREERMFVDGNSISALKPGDEVYLVHTDWSAQWRHFVSNTHAAPGIIPNHMLTTGTARLMRLKPNVVPVQHFRPVSPAVWKFLFERYGATAIISTVIPPDYPERDCETLAQPTTNFRWSDHSRAVMPSDTKEQALASSNLLFGGELKSTESFTNKTNSDLGEEEILHILSGDYHGEMDAQLETLVDRVVNGDLTPVDRRPFAKAQFAAGEGKGLPRTGSARRRHSERSSLSDNSTIEVEVKIDHERASQDVFELDPLHEHVPVASPQHNSSWRSKRSEASSISLHDLELRPSASSGRVSDMSSPSRRPSATTMSISTIHKVVNFQDAESPTLNRVASGKELPIPTLQRFKSAKDLAQPTVLQRFRSAKELRQPATPRSQDSRTVNPPSVSTASSNRRPAQRMTLHLAASQNMTVDVATLIRNGANVNAMDSDLNTPLLLTSDVEVVHELCRHGADVSIRNQSGLTALHLAVIRRDEQAVEALLDYGCNVNVQARGTGFTPLHFAAKIGSSSIMRMLLTHPTENSAKQSIEDIDGNTVLHTVTNAEYFDATVDIVNMLLQHGADPVGTNHNELTPLHLTAGNVSFKQANTASIVMEALLATGVNPNIPQHDGCTPVHLAAKHKNWALLALLLANGADLNRVWLPRSPTANSVTAMAMIPAARKRELLPLITTPQSPIAEAGVTKCMQCQTEFSMFLWKTHCGLCQRILCSKCVREDLRVRELPPAIANAAKTSRVTCCTVCIPIS